MHVILLNSLLFNAHCSLMGLMFPNQCMAHVYLMSMSVFTRKYLLLRPCHIYFSGKNVDLYLSIFLFKSRRGNLSCLKYTTPEICIGPTRGFTSCSSVSCIRLAHFGKVFLLISNETSAQVSNSLYQR